MRELIHKPVDIIPLTVLPFNPGDLLRNEAHEFFLGFGPITNVQRTAAELVIYVSTGSQDTVMFTMDTLLGFTFNGTVSLGSPAKVIVPQDFVVTDHSSSQRQKGIHVKAEENKTIAVFGLNYDGDSSDAYLALPCNHLPVQQYEYYAVTYSAYRYYTPFALLVGCEDSTTITTVPFQFTLNRLETYLMSDITTGARIVTDKPIAFFSGHQSAVVYPTSPSYGHLVEQLPPTFTWGTFFLAGVGTGVLNRYTLYMVLAAHDETHVNVTCTNKGSSTSVISTGGTYQIFTNIGGESLRSLCVIEADKPLLVLVLQSVQGTYGWSAFMSLLPPANQYNNNYSLPIGSTSTGYFHFNSVTISVLPQYFDESRIYVDNRIPSTYWISTKCSNGTICGYATTVSAVHFVKHLDNDGKIGVIVFGFGNSAYGCPAGFHIESLNHGK